nr:hypothetical protein [Tanacetum cinerariifolium]
MGTMGMVFLSFYFCILFVSADRNGQPSAYRFLKGYNLSIGVLPKDALGYTLDCNSGPYSVSQTSNSNVNWENSIYASTKHKWIAAIALSGIALLFYVLSEPSRVHNRAESTAELTMSRIHCRRCQRMLHGATAVTVAVMIVALHTIYPPVAGVASLTEAKAPENPIWTEGKWAGCIPARRPRISDPDSLDTSYAIPALDIYQCGHPAAPAKVVQYQQGFPQDSTLGTKPEPLKIAKTKQRARLYASRDLGHLLAFEIRCSPPPQCTHNSADVEKLKKKNKYLTKQVNLMMKLFRSDEKFSQMLNQYESSPEFGNASRSGGCGDDEMADDEDGGKDEEDEEDGDS